MKIFLVFFLIVAFSCSQQTTKEILKEKLSLFEISEWDSIESIISTKPSFDTIVEKYGQPSKALVAKEEKNLIYRFGEEEYPKWIFSFNLIGHLQDFAFYPSDEKEKRVFISDLEKKWSNFNCVKKEEQQLQTGLVAIKNILVCDNGRRFAEFDRFGEVSIVKVVLQ